MGWILETNEPMNRAMEGMGGKVVKRYRIYERALERHVEPARSGVYAIRRAVPPDALARVGR